jgi:protein-L-isoaspartate O-methyltransferase
LCGAAPRSYPEDLISILKTDAKLVIPVGGSKQVLKTIKKLNKEEVEESTYDDVSFVPMLAGISEDGID